MINSQNRIGRFTSSNIWKLTTQGRGELGFGAPAITYINEKRAERCLGRSIDTGAYSQPLIWGKIMEYYAFKFHLGLEYNLCSKETIVHPKYKFWSGSPDVDTNILTGECKCYYPKAFFEFSEALQIGDLNAIKTDFKEEYWQVVSNAILQGKSIAELICYTPSEKQLIQIRQEIEETNLLEKLEIEPWQGRFIVEKPLYELPYIPDGIEWPNFVSFKFDVANDDVIFLTKCVLNAEKLLTYGK
jgi:hypothetical protein